MTSSALAPAPSATQHYTHTSANGFCTVCGTVWPCAAASRTPVQAVLALPVAR